MSDASTPWWLLAAAVVMAIVVVAAWCEQVAYERRTAAKREPKRLPSIPPQNGRNS